MARRYLTDDMYYDDETEQLYKGTSVIEIKGKRWKLFLYLLHHGKSASYDEIIDHVWNGDATYGTLITTVKRLRQDINDKNHTIVHQPNEGYYQIIPIKIERGESEPTYIHLPSQLSYSFALNATEETVIRRKPVCDTITGYLHKPGNRSMLLYGYGGVGKTSVARLLYTILEPNYDCIGWIDYQKDLISSMLSCLDTTDYMDTSLLEADRQKQWKYISHVLKNSEEKKLFVIDNVDTDVQINQNPLTDMTLKEITAWKNTDVIITSRFSELEPYVPLEIHNLGNEKNDTFCLELFYHYSPGAKENRSNNDNIVRRLIQLAGYNSLVIELLAKISDCCHTDLVAFYADLQEKGFSFPEMSVDTLHNKYRDDTAAHQLRKLYDLQRRSSVEQCILWYFYTLPEGKKVSRKELIKWLGYTPAEAGLLVKEGWLSFMSGFYYMHPLIRQTMQTTDEKWIEYWKLNEEFFAQNHREYIIKKLRQQTFFEKDDSFQVIRDKLTFADALTRSCLQMDVEDILYIADCARKHSIRTMGVKYYGLAYERIKKELEDSGFLKDFSLSYVPLHSLFSLEDYEAYDSYYLDRAELYWKCCYYYGYMLSYTQNMYARAETLIMQSLYISQRVFPKTSGFQLSRSYSHLGYIHSFDPDKVPQALMEFAHAINSTGLDFDRIYNNTPESMHHYAWCIDDYGSFCAMNYDKLLSLQTPEEFDSTIDLAEHYLHEALSIREYLADCADNKNSTEVAWTCVNLARLLGKKNNQSAEAESLLEKAIGIYEVLDERTPKLHYGSMARAYVAYGQILENQPERYDDAVEKYNCALALNTALESDSPGTYTKEIQDIESALETLEKQIDEKMSYSFTLQP